MSATVRVRIAVVVDANGNWGAAGWRNAREEAAMRASRWHYSASDGGRYWIEADLPLPTVPVIAGDVSEAA